MLYLERVACAIDKLVLSSTHVLCPFLLRVQTIYCARDQTTGRYKAHKLKGEEVAYVDQVRSG